MAACYLLLSTDERHTYIGATTDVTRRLRQHNGEISGGARATQKYRPWEIVCVVSGFREWREALSFEYRWKKRTRGRAARLKRMDELLLSRCHLVRNLVAKVESFQNVIAVEGTEPVEST